MAEVVLCAASAVAGCVVAPVNRLCGYVISYDSHVCKLEDKVAELRKAREEVQDSINDAQNNGKTIKAYVNDWVKDVEEHTEEARRVLDDKAKITCFCGWLPNPKVRYHLGREARRKAERIQGLIDRTPSGKVYDDPPPGLVDGTSDMISSAGDRGYTNFDSQASILEDIMNALGDEKHKVIGIYGEGGVGKTTLLKQVEEKLRIEKRLFRMIVKSNVSQNPDFKKIQDNIAFALDQKNLKDETSEEGRKELLFKRLQNDPSEKVLIILDDLWKDLDLGAVGIPSKDESKGCKLLLTSRFRNVLEQMECHNSIFHLQGLKDDEAFRLFEKKVGDRLKDDEDLKTIADQLVKKLAGLPLLIISVANFLKDKDKYAWRTARIEIDESNKEIKETIVKLSYNHLKSEDAKTLFLLCGLIGGTIQVETLLVLGMGLSLFGEFRRTMQKSRDRLNTILDELRSACLLLDGGDDKNNVTIHDLYSEVAVSDSFRGQNSFMMNSNYGSWSKEKLEKCWAICLANVDQKRLDELMKCQFPDLKILMLSQPGGWRWKQEHEREVGDCSRLPDFTYMKELRVLYFCSHIANLPTSIGILGNLHSLYLKYCNVEDVAILGKLKALQILSFAQSTISRLPKEIGELTNLRSLNLIECYKLETIEPGVLNRLTNLEELHIYGFSRWMGKDQIPSESCNARLAELKSLTKLSALAILIPNPTMLLKDGDLPFGNLDRFKIKIGNTRMLYEGLTTMNLNLDGCDSILLKKWVQKILQKTQYLYLRGLSEFKESPKELCTQGFQEVKSLDIIDSPSIKYIADSSNGLSLTAFGKLEDFSLENLNNLEKICHGPVAPECFNKLKAVRVRQCDQLKYLWCLSDVQKLVQLEEISVNECGSMQSIVAHDAGEDIVSTNNRVELPNVRCLKLFELPNMTGFCDTSIQVSLPHLESLTMFGFHDPEKILYSEPSLKYSNLKWLKIGKSKSAWKSILKLDWLLKLPNLESMSLESSPTAEVVFDLEELKVIKDVEICSQLTNLTLDHLPNLQCMWKRDVKLQGISIFQNLRDLFVYKTGLSFLFSVYVAKCLRKIRVIRMCDCPNMKVVIVDEEGRNEGTYDIIEFPLLEHLSIQQCPMEKFFSYPHVKKEPVTTTSDLQDAHSNSFFDRKASLSSLAFLWLHSVGSFKRIWQDELPRSPFYELATLILENSFELLQCLPFDNHTKIAQSRRIGVSNRCLIVTFPNITRLEISGLQSKELCNDQIPTDSFQKLESLQLSKCDNLQHIATSYMWKKLQLCLKELKVISCPSIEIIYEGDGTDTETGELRMMVLRDLENLRSIWESDSLPNIPFPNLRDIKAVRCPRLGMLFPTFTAKFLGQIKKLVVKSCEDMEQIAGHEKGEEATGTTITFSELTDLKLSKLPKFKSFLPDKYSLKFPCSEDFPSLQVLSIVSCGAEPDQLLDYSEESDQSYGAESDQLLDYSEESDQSYGAESDQVLDYSEDSQTE